MTLVVGSGGGEACLPSCGSFIRSMMVEVRAEDWRTKVDAGVVEGVRVRGRLELLRGGVWVMKELDGVCTLAISVCDMDCGSEA